MCTSSGVGDGGAAEREAGRQKKQDLAMARINSLFGVDTSENLTAPDKNNPKYQMSSDNGLLIDVAKYNQDLAQYNQLKSASDGTAGNKEKLDTLYSGVGSDVTDYLSKDLNDQYTNAERGGRFSAARRGIRGGSSELDMQDKMTKQFDKGVVDIDNRATNAENSFRTADSSTRLSLVQRILNGMSGDAAITSAQQAMTDNLNVAKNEAVSKSLDNVFGDFSTINNAQAKQRGQQKAGEYYGTYYPSSNKRYSGSNS